MLELVAFKSETLKQLNERIGNLPITSRTQDQIHQERNSLVQSVLATNKIDYDTIMKLDYLSLSANCVMKALCSNLEKQKLLKFYYVYKNDFDNPNIDYPENVLSDSTECQLAIIIQAYMFAQTGEASYYERHTLLVRHKVNIQL